MFVCRRMTETDLTYEAVTGLTLVLNFIFLYFLYFCKMEK